MRTRRTFVLAFSRARLNSYPSVSVCKKTFYLVEPKAHDNIIEKNIPKRVGAKAHLCFTPLRISNCLEIAPL